MKKLLFSFIAIFFISISVFLLWKISSSPKKNSYLFMVSDVDFDSANIPQIKVKIDQDHIVLASLDLGYRGEISASKKILDLFPQKKLLGEGEARGWNGQAFLHHVYAIDSIVISNAEFFNLHLEESSLEFEKNVVLNEEKEDLCEYDKIMRLGWLLFKSTNLYLDLANKEIAFCDSAQTLINHNLNLESFGKTELILANGSLEFNVQTIEGPLRCSLDTGATLNAICRPSEDERKIIDMMTDPKNIETLPSFKVGNVDLGPLSFHKVPSQLRKEEDTVLGMEFFLKNRVFIDFSKKEIYFSPSL